MENVKFTISTLANPASFIVNAHNELGAQIGYIYIPEKCIITDMWVHPDYRRRGIATAMYERVADKPWIIYHDAVHHQTDDYIKWQETVGGYIAPPELAYDDSCSVCTGELELWED